MRSLIIDFWMEKCESKTVMQETAVQLSRLIGVIYLPRLEMSPGVEKAREDAFGVLDLHVREIVALLMGFSTTS
jgi:hypothetical protein